MKIFKNSNKSLLNRILVSLLAVMLIQAALFYCAIFKSGTMDKLKDNSFRIFNEKVNGRKNLLQNDMLTRWGDIQSTVEDINSSVSSILEGTGKITAELNVDTPSGQAALMRISESILAVMERNTVSGAFAVFEGNGSEQKSGIYLRDSDPATTTVDHSDLLAVRGPSAITKEYRIALDRFWTPYFSIDKTDSTYDFYNKPYNEAKKNPEIGSEDLGYWSSPFLLNGCERGDTCRIITYSVPLIMDGEVYGVVGIEVSLDYLNSQLPSKELNLGNYGGYILAVKKESDSQETSNEYEMISQSGLITKQLFENEEKLELTQNGVQGNFYPIVSVDIKERPLYGCVQELELYNRYTPFENEKWTLIGVVSDQNLLSFFYNFKDSIMVLIGVILLIGIMASVLLARVVASPIIYLSKKLKGINANQPIYLDRIHIAEIDELSRTIENLSDEVAGNSNKLSAILTMSDIKIGACEYNHEYKDKLFCTGQFCQLLGIEQKEDYVDSKKVRDAIEEWKPYIVNSEKTEDSGVHIFHITGEEAPCWMRLSMVTEENRTLLVLTDITKEMEEKVKLRYERDYDILTNLYNRRAFYTQLKQLFEKPEQLKQGAMVMVDLDNLKYVNDTYGHDYGDEYIKMAANVLKEYPGEHSLISRLSGDEFMVFVYGYQSQEEIQNDFNQMFMKFKNAKINFPDKSVIQVRASAGMASYPSDAKDYKSLIKYSDFTMYMVKKTNKGRVAAFNMNSYHQESYLLQCKEELNTLIEEGRMDYMFQPIVSVKSGEVFAYEALMRPRSQNIRTPLELLNLARAQSQLHQIERLTFVKALENFDKLNISKDHCKIFINSIANQHLGSEDMQLIEVKYKKYLSHIVIEITEEDKLDEDIMKSKKAVMRRWGAELAIDDFGTGYNSEAALLSLTPNYIKIDRSLVEKIHKDDGKKMLLQHMVFYAKEQGIKTIAEGVETSDEMQVLIESGVDYLQGYYVSRPSFIPICPGEEVRKQILEMGKTFQN